MKHASSAQPGFLLLQDLVKELQVPPSRYKEAEKRYKSLGEWLHRQNSTVRDGAPDVYVQGSFQLGTAIKPASDEEDYDIDMVCCLNYEKLKITQADLKRQVGFEIKAYANYHNMGAPQEKRRCWTLSYADNAQFHTDILPSLPDPEKREFLARPDLKRLSATALAITDQKHPHYQQLSGDWLGSNPKGYALWFRDKMGRVFRERAQMEAMQMQMSVEDVPAYQVRTPLQDTIQLLKRHRDLMFSERSDEKPVSILITTLAAHAYQQEEKLAYALLSILEYMDRFIGNRHGVDWVQNPTDPDENFADKWSEYPERRTAFFEWLNQARNDFNAAMRASTAEEAGQCLTQPLGASLVQRALSRSNPNQKPVLANLVESPQMILRPAHMRKPQWEHAPEGRVDIISATCMQNGFRPRNFRSEEALSKHCNLRFKAKTSVTGSYRVYWQVVNTGVEAEASSGLRGGFDHDYLVRDRLIRNESTLYQGYHSIECFIVKNGKLAARSGQFIVRIV
ncbi:MAG: nucleotidyltransferase [Candidatus Dadabacteria bacterium]|nr:nucleotidyltransferase [Candidatus Dadabacteria bacterium]